MNDELTPVRVWDLPTRVFHWLLASCVIASIVSAQIGGNALVWNFRMGRTRALALVLVALCAGLVTWIVSLGD